MKDPAGVQPVEQLGGHAFVSLLYALEFESPMRPSAGFVSCVSPVFQPDCVPVVGNVRVILSHVVLRIWILSFVPPPVASMPVPLKMRSGRTNPHDRLVPVSVVPLTLNVVRSQMLMLPVPALPAVLEGQPTWKVIFVPSVTE